MSVQKESWFCRPQETPQRLQAVALIDTEKQLEDWAEADPTILGDGYVVVGRQVQFEGGPADLIVIDPQGRWVVVEIKRSSNDRQDLAQALDYAASLRIEEASALRSRLVGRLQGKAYAADAIAQIDAALSDEADGPREVAIMIVGVGLQPRAERIMNLLAEYSFDVRVANFSAHRTADGALVLSREIAAPDTSPETSTGSDSRESVSLEALSQIAQSYGCGEPFQRWVSLAENAGLYARAYKHSVMLTPPQHHNAYLSVARPMSGGRLRINHGPVEIAQWFPWVTAAEVEQALGPSERGMGKVYEGAALQEYLDRLEAFLPRLAEAPEGYVAADEQTPWTRDRFISLFASRPHEATIVTALLDSVAPNGDVEFGRAVVGQAYLRYLPAAPVVLQVTGRGRVQGMWAMGTIDRDHPGWAPLKTVLGAYGGGVNATGGSVGIRLSSLAKDDVGTLAAAARETTAALTQP